MITVIASAFTDALARLPSHKKADYEGWNPKAQHKAQLGRAGLHQEDRPELTWIEGTPGLRLDNKSEAGRL